MQDEYFRRNYSFHQEEKHPLANMLYSDSYTMMMMDLDERSIDWEKLIVNWYLPAQIADGASRTCSRKRRNDAVKSRLKSSDGISVD